VKNFWPASFAVVILLLIMQQMQLHQHRQCLTKLADHQVFLLQNMEKMAENHHTMSSNQLAGAQIMKSQQANLERLFNLQSNVTSVAHLAWMISNRVSIQFYDRQPTNEIEKTTIAPFTL
jgi:hypothetical protein